MKAERKRGGKNAGSDRAIPVGAESESVKGDKPPAVGKTRQVKRHGHGHKARHQAAFLRAFVRCGTVLHAAKAAGIDRDEHYNWLRDDPNYKARFLAADEDATQELEQVALKRAKRASDTLTIFLLKAKRPAVYRERYEVSHGNTEDKPFKVYLVDTDPV